MNRLRKCLWMRWLGVLPLAVCWGCTTVNSFLGADGKYVLKAYDVLALPGRPVQAYARLESGTIQRDLPDRTIRFFKNGSLFKKVVTDEQGYALVKFTPPRPGDYVFSIYADQADLKHQAPKPVTLLVACRRAQTPMIVVDVDKTLAATKSWRFFRKNPAPMPGSPAVMKRLAQDYAVVYMTHRPQQYGHRTKGWLAKRGFPRGPLLMPEATEFVRGSGRYKSRQLRKLKSVFPNLRIGIGDKISDAQAYQQNGMRAFLIVDLEEPDDARDCLKLANELEGLAGQVQVVQGWDQIEAAIYEGKSFPRPAAQQQLRRRAERL